jgi:benzoate membrane transport protein
MLEAVAGLALLGTLASAISAALADTEDRIAPAVTFLMAASGLAFAGIGSAFWALIAGLAVRWVLQPRRSGTAS